MTEEFQSITQISQSVFWFSLIAGVAAVAFGFWFTKRAMNPQLHVNRIRKTRGIDLLANVADKETYFRFLRVNQGSLGVLIVALGAVLIGGAFLVKRQLGELRTATDGLLEFTQGIQGQSLLVDRQNWLGKTEATADRAQELADALKSGDKNAIERAQQALKEALEESSVADEKLRKTIEDYSETASDRERLGELE